MHRHHPSSATTPPVPRVPRPGRDRIRSPLEALCIAALAAPRPMADQSFVIVTDRWLRGIGLAITPVGVRPTATQVTHATCGFARADGVIVVTTRHDRAVAPGDAAGWESLSSSLYRSGTPLIDWIVVGRGGFYCPRVLTSSPDPWTRVSRIR